MAGRQSFLDGGLYLFGLDIATGQIKCETRIEGPYGDDGESILDVAQGKDAPWRVFTQIKGNQSDILVADADGTGTAGKLGIALDDDATEINSGKRQLS